MKTNWLILSLICLMLHACKTKDVVDPDAYEGPKLILSHGGGFTGKYKTYCLLDNGQVFVGDEQHIAATPTKKLDKDIAKQIFSNYETLGLGNMQVESYGNLNYSVIMINEDGAEHKLIWGDRQEGTSQLQVFYDNIMNIIKQNMASDMPTNSGKQ